MVVVSISEMYDLRTEKGKMALIGVHTPNFGQICRRWLGLALNHKFYRLLSCDVAVSCAAMMPADPLQVGVDSDEISPQDLMNPILYRAMTNETWNTVLARLFASGTAGSGGLAVDANSVKAFTDAFAGLTQDEQESMYYTLLSLPEWRKAMPQSGLNMYKLRPLVFPVLSQIGNGLAIPSSLGTLATGQYGADNKGAPNSVGGQSSPNVNTLRYYRGHAQPMPRMPCTVPNADFGDPAVYIGDNATNTAVASNNMGRTYVCGILMPPARTKEMYFRMRVVWHVEFSELCTITDKSTSPQDTLGYLRSYEFSEANRAPDSKDTGCLETVGVDPTMIMEV